MDQKAKTEELMTRYLLGRLSETERTQVEQVFFANNEYFEQLLSVEDALIDRYSLDDLSPDDRKAFEELLRSSPQEWQELEFTRDLIKTVSKADSSQKRDALQTDLNFRAKLVPILARLQARAKAVSTIASLVLLLMLSVSLLAWNLYLLPRKMRAEAELAEAKRINLEIQRQNIEERERSERVAQELEEEKARNQQAEQLIAQLERSSKDATEIARIELSPDTISRNSGSLKVLNLKTGVSKVQIHLNIEENANYRQYRAVIRSFEGNEIWNSKHLDANEVRRHRLLLVVPANVLSANDYTITLSGVLEGSRATEVADYSFRVSR